MVLELVVLAAVAVLGVVVVVGLPELPVPPMFLISLVTPLGMPSIWLTMVSEMLGALRSDGTIAAMVYEGGTDVPVMRAFAEGELQRILRPRDIVVMDNLSAHKDAGVIAAIESAGAIACYLPPYSPDFNPIESMWSKVKETLRSIKARTAEALLDAIGVALRSITTTDAEGWFEHCGYGNTQE